MNTKRLILMCLSGILFLVTGCDKDDDDSNKGNLPPKEVLQAFNTKYPNAQNISWENNGGYYIAEFTNSSVETDAWFSEQGIWTMSKESTTYNQLPPVVSTALKNSSYANWKVDDCYFIQRESLASIYKIEVESNNQENDLYYTEYGNLIKVVNDNNDNNEDTPLIVPAKVIDMVNLTFAGSIIVDLQQNAKGYELDLLDKTVYKIVQLNAEYFWQSTTWEVSLQEVPQDIISGFENSEYANDKIVKILLFTNADGAFHQFVVVHNGKEVVVTFDVFGNIVQE